MQNLYSYKISKSCYSNFYDFNLYTTDNFTAKEKFFECKIFECLQFRFLLYLVYNLLKKFSTEELETLNKIEALAFRTRNLGVF